LTTSKALSFLSTAVNSPNPFFLMVAPLAPHVELLGQNNQAKPNVSYGPGILHNPVPQPQYASSFPNATVPRTPNFNPDTPSGASWVRTLPQQNSTVVASNDLLYRNRLQVLAGIDDMVGTLVSALESYNILDDTYIVFTADNGYHIGQHRLQPGKKCGYETDVNIPLFIRGPGVPAGLTSQISSSHTDLAPTFFHMLGVPLRSDFDGAPIPLTKLEMDAEQNSGRSEHVNVEFWGTPSGTEGRFPSLNAPGNNTYKAIRLFGDGYNLFYSVWCDGSHEVYVCFFLPTFLPTFPPTFPPTFSFYNALVCFISAQQTHVECVIPTCG
jgi:arylsulfatase A-like enzyme